jgi:hypothetical protein
MFGLGLLAALPVPGLLAGPLVVPTTYLGLSARFDSLTPSRDTFRIAMTLRPPGE